MTFQEYLAEQWQRRQRRNGADGWFWFRSPTWRDVLVNASVDFYDEVISSIVRGKT